MTPANHRHILYGALVGGPEEANDNSYEDVISNYTANEVACDYNAGLVGVLAKMCDLYGGTPLTNFPVAEEKDDEFFVEASLNQSSSTYTEIKALLNNRSGWPARTIENLSFKYFMDLSEVYDAGYTKDDITISSIKHFKDDIYYVEIALKDGTNIYPGGQSEYAAEVQFRISAPSGTTFWDATNDYSGNQLQIQLLKQQQYLFMIMEI